MTDTPPKTPEYPNADQVRASHARVLAFVDLAFPDGGAPKVIEAYLGWVGGTIAKLEMATWVYGPEQLSAEVAKVRQHQAVTKAADAKAAQGALVASDERKAAADPVAKGTKAAGLRVEIKRLARTSTAAKLQLNYWLQRMKMPDATFEALDQLPMEMLDDLQALLVMRAKVPWWPLWDPTVNAGKGGYRCPGIGCGSPMYDNGPDAKSKRDPSKNAPWLSCSNKACTLGDGKFGLAIWSSAEMPGALKQQGKDAAGPEATDA